MTSNVADNVEEMPVVYVRLENVVKQLCKAAKLGRLKEEGIITDEVVESPHGIDYIPLGEDIIKMIKALPEWHSTRAKIDTTKMREGIEYIRKGVIKVRSEYFGTQPVVEGDNYIVRIGYDAKLGLNGFL